MAELILQGFKRSMNFISATAHFIRVKLKSPHMVFRVNKKHSPYTLVACAFGVNHAITVRDSCGAVNYKREFDFNLPAAFVIDFFEVGFLVFMRSHSVNRNYNNMCAQRPELILPVSKF